MDDNWTKSVTRQIGARLKTALDRELANISPLMVEKLEQLRRAEEQLHSLGDATQKANAVK